MWKYLDTIRQRPEPQKKLFSLITAICITIIIAISWFTVSISSFSSSEAETQSVATSPFAALGKQFGVIRNLFSTSSVIENNAEDGNLIQ